MIGLQMLSWQPYQRFHIRPNFDATNDEAKRCAHFLQQRKLSALVTTSVTTTSIQRLNLFDTETPIVINTCVWFFLK